MFTQSPVAKASGARASLSEVRHRLDDSFEAAMQIEGEDGALSFETACAVTKEKLNQIRIQVDDLTKVNLINGDGMAPEFLDPKFLESRFDAAAEPEPVAQDDQPHRHHSKSVTAVNGVQLDATGATANLGTASGGIPHDIPLEYWCAQYQEAYEAKLSYDTVLADIINPSTVRSFEQAIPDSEYNSERHANLYQLVGRAVTSLNQHETSERRDRKKTSQRTPQQIVSQPYAATPAGKRKVNEATERLCATVLAAIEHEIEQLPPAQSAFKRILTTVWKHCGEVTVKTVRRMYLEEYMHQAPPRQHSASERPVRTSGQLLNADPATSGWSMVAPDRTADYEVQITVSTNVSELQNNCLFTLDALSWFLHSPNAFPPAHKFDGRPPWTGSIMSYLQEASSAAGFRGFEMNKFTSNPKLTDEQVEAKLGLTQRAPRRRTSGNATDGVSGVGESPAPAPAPAPAPGAAADGQDTARKAISKLKYECLKKARFGSVQVIAKYLTGLQMDEKEAKRCALSLFTPFKVKYGLGAPVTISKDEFTVIHALVDYSISQGAGYCGLCDTATGDTDNLVARCCKVNECPSLQKALAHERAGKPLPPDAYYATRVQGQCRRANLEGKAWTIFRPVDGVYPTETTKDTYDFQTANIKCSLPPKWSQMIAKVKAALPDPSNIEKLYDSATGVGKIVSDQPTNPGRNLPWHDYVKHENFIGAVTSVAHTHTVHGYQDRTDKALAYLQTMEHQKLGKVSQADADRAADEYKLPGFDLACVPADFETDQFVQACKAVNATPGTRIAQVSSKVAKMIRSKQNSRAKLQKKVTKHYQEMGILAVYAPGVEGLKVATDGSVEAGKIADKGSVVFLSQDSSSF